MNKPLLLDLFCKAGGCSKGYTLAGFEIIGIDIEPQPNYPYDFIQADALETLDNPTFLAQFDVIHASPPCQYYTRMLNHGLSNRYKHPDLVDIVRTQLQTTGKIYVIENVPGSPIEKMIMLCGAMFGLRVYRHRHFESNVLLFQPNHPHHTNRVAHAGNIPIREQFYSPVGHMGDKNGAQRAMGIDWMQTTEEIANAIPPTYTEWIGKLLLEYVTKR